MFWQGIPQKWTISKEEAERRYSVVHPHLDGVLTYSDGSYTPRGEHNEPIVYIDRCSPWYNVMKHKWEHSSSNGGYVEAVTRRYLRRKFPNGELNWNTRGLHCVFVDDTVNRLGDKYGLAVRTRRAVYDHIQDGWYRDYIVLDQAT